jgi:hypothetical protein
MRIVTEKMTLTSDTASSASHRESSSEREPREPLFEFGRQSFTPPR